ncbi:MAG: hypothetical protein AB7S26_30760 [Sandaracinaceae bacterium]
MGVAIDAPNGECEAVRTWMDELGRLLERASEDARQRLDAIRHRSRAWILSDFVEPPLKSTVIILDATASTDAAVRFSWLDGGGWRGAGAPPEPLRSFVEQNWSQFRANAIGRTVSTALPPHHMCTQIVSGGEIWFTASSLTNIDPAALVALHDHPRQAPVDATPRASGPFIASTEAAGEREDLAIRRWLHVTGRAELPAAFGLDACCWIGIGLSRSLVFDERVNGDVDLVLGRMRWDMPDEERDAYVERARRESSLLTHQSNVRIFAAMGAAADGRLSWDESSPLIGIEAKATWYDTAAGRWKRTHRSSGAVREVLGNLKMLRARGFDHVALLHLAATAPRVTNVHSWFQASRDLAAAAAHAQERLPLDTDQLGGAAYLIATMGAVPGTTEEYAGVGGRLEVAVAGAPIAARLDARPMWREKLRARLVSLGRPRFPPPVFVLECAGCTRWFLSGWPDVPRHGCGA